jgi:hypothetical protein
MRRFRGIIHVHSTFSYDGRHSLDEIAAMAKQRGYHFVGMSEHSDTLDEAKVSDLIAACRQVSTPDCLIIPGIEFTCDDNLHLLAVGIQCYTDQTNPAAVAQFVRESGGVAIVAHPVRYQYQIPSDMVSHLDGIEVWNAGYDGRFVPNDRSLDLVERLRHQNPRLATFCGQDLHRIQEYDHVVLSLSCEALEQETILRALRNGRFTVSNRYFHLDGLASPRPMQMRWIRLARWFYESAKALRG